LPACPHFAELSIANLQQFGVVLVQQKLLRKSLIPLALLALTLVLVLTRNITLDRQQDRIVVREVHGLNPPACSHRPQ
jgi:hypothetical protein